MTTTLHRNRGFSLIELMVSLLLTSFVLIAVVGLFNQSKGNQVQNEQIARMQENGRYTVRLIARNIAMAGYFGGLLTTVGVSQESPLGGTDCNTDWMLEMEPSIEFENDATASPYACIADDEIMPDTDMIATKRVSDNADRVSSTTGVMSGSLNPGAIYLKTNGDDGVLFDASGGTDNGPEPPTAGSPFDIRQYYAEILYVSPEFRLMRWTLIGDDMQPQTLVDGIQNIQVEFGIDGTDTDVAADYYEPDPDAAELENAVTARVYVLVRSVDPVAGYLNDKTYNLGTTTVGPFNDAYYRRVYSTTAAIRNSAKLKLQAL